MQLRILAYIKAAQPIPKFITHLLAFVMGLGIVVQMEEKSQPLSFQGVLISLPKKFKFQDGDIVYLQSKQKKCLVSELPFRVKTVGQTKALLLDKKMSSKAIMNFVLSRDFAMSLDVPSQKCLLGQTKVKYG